MKKLIKKLPLIGFILAIGAAFAFNQPKAEEAQVYRQDENGNWTIPVTGNYRCDVDPTEDCTAELDEQGQPMNITEGKFVEL